MSGRRRSFAQVNNIWSIIGNPGYRYENGNKNKSKSAQKGGKNKNNGFVTHGT